MSGVMLGERSRDDRVSVFAVHRRFDPEWDPAVHGRLRRGGTRRLWARAIVLSALVATPIAVSAGPAYAATGVNRSGDQLTVTATAGRIKDIFVRRSPDGSAFLVRDRGDTLTPGTGCQAAGREVVCSASGVRRVVVNAGDGNDRISVVTRGGQGILNGGTGNDILSAGRPGSDRNTLNGGQGDDVLSGDIFDVFFGGSGNDRLDGGPGFDDRCVNGEIVLNCEVLS